MRSSFLIPFPSRIAASTSRFLHYTSSLLCSESGSLGHVSGDDRHDLGSRCDVNETYSMHRRCWLTLVVVREKEEKISDKSI